MKDGEISYSEQNGITNINDKNQFILNLLDTNYIKENQIKINNIEKYTNNITNNYGFSVNKMYEINDERIKEYVVYINLEEVKNLCFLIILDTQNNTYMIRPLKYIENDILKKEDVYEKIESIEKNSNNGFQYNRVTDEEMAKKYFYDFKNKLYNKSEYIYEKLDENYRNQRFKNMENYLQYLENNREEFSKINITKFLKNEKEDYEEYICKDQFDNIYIFKVNAVMDYKIQLDTYTIPTEKFKEEYNKVDDIEKVQINIDKFFQMMNRHDYDTSYNYLSKSFANNYFETTEKFKNFAENKFFKYNKIEYKNCDKKGNDLYVFNVNIKDLTGENTENRNIDIIMKLDGDINFEMSFSI